MASDKSPEKFASPVEHTPQGLSQSCQHRHQPHRCKQRMRNQRMNCRGIRRYHDPIHHKVPMDSMWGILSSLPNSTGIRNDECFAGPTLHLITDPDFVGNPQVTVYVRVVGVCESQGHTIVERNSSEWVYPVLSAVRERNHLGHRSGA